MPRMKASDSFYTSETRQVSAGHEFEIDSDERAKELEARGLAEIVGGAKSEPKSQNKAEPAPFNKTDVKDHAPRDDKAGDKQLNRNHRKGADR